MPYVMINNKKCTGCHMCELACSAWHEGAFRPSVARLHVEKLGGRLTQMTPRQAEYVNIPADGPYKSEHYRY